MIGKLKQLLALQRSDDDFLVSFSRHNFGDSRTFAKEIILDGGSGKVQKKPVQNLSQGRREGNCIMTS